MYENSSQLLAPPQFFCAGRCIMIHWRTSRQFLKIPVYQLYNSNTSNVNCRYGHPRRKITFFEYTEKYKIFGQCFPKTELKRFVIGISTPSLHLGHFSRLKIACLPICSAESHTILTYLYLIHTYNFKYAVIFKNSNIALKNKICCH